MISNVSAILGLRSPTAFKIRPQVARTLEFCQRIVALDMQRSTAGEVPMNNPPEHDQKDLSMRARAEFREMPGMCLTTAQAARLWQLSPDRAEELLSELVQCGFLVRREGQRYRLPSSV